MSSFLYEIGSDHKEIERELGALETAGYVALTWGGSNYPCSYSTVGTTEAMMLAGFTVNVELVVRIRIKSDDSDDIVWDWSESGGPQEGDTVTFKTTAYKIKSRRDVHKKILVMTLGSINA